MHRGYWRLVVTTQFVRDERRLRHDARQRAELASSLRWLAHDPFDPRLHSHRIKGHGRNWYSSDVGGRRRGLRLIWRRDGHDVTLAGVAKHDVAYSKVIGRSDLRQVEPRTFETEPVADESVRCPFFLWSDHELIAVGLDASELSLVKAVQSEDELLDLCEKIPQHKANRLLGVYLESGAATRAPADPAQVAAAGAVAAGLARLAVRSATRFANVSLPPGVAAAAGVTGALFGGLLARPRPAREPRTYLVRPPEANASWYRRKPRDVWEADIANIHRLIAETGRGLGLKLRLELIESSEAICATNAGRVQVSTEVFDRLDSCLLHALALHELGHVAAGHTAAVSRFRRIAIEGLLEFRILPVLDAVMSQRGRARDRVVRTMVDALLFAGGELLIQFLYVALEDEADARALEFGADPTDLATALDAVARLCGRPFWRSVASVVSGDSVVGHASPHYRNAVAKARRLRASVGRC